MAISSCLKQKGYDVKIVDRALEENAHNQVLESIDEALCLGITCMTGPQLFEALRIAQKAKTKRPELPIVWGGFHPTLFPEQTVAHPLVDIVVRGQGEETIVELVRAFEGKSLMKSILGITYKKDGAIISNPKRPVRDINTFPMLDYEGIDLQSYARSGPIAYVSSRGCPHRCAFCAVKCFYGQRWVYYPPTRVLDELRGLVEDFGISRICFYDDNFFVDKRRVEKICDGLMGSGLDIEWEALGRCDYFARYNERFLSKLRMAGMRLVSFGAESGSPKILQVIRKDISPSDTIKAAKNCRDAGIDTDFTFMSGLPSETLEDLRQTIDLINRIYAISPSTSVRLFSYTPSPGTDLLVECTRLGLKQPTSLEDWGSFCYQRHMNPWVSRKHSQLIRVLDSLLPYLPKASHVGFNFPYELLRMILRWDAKFRWRYKLFKHSYEWKLITSLRYLYYT